MKIVGATLGNCVHTEGLHNFLALAGGHGHAVRFLGVGLAPEALARAVRREKPGAVALSYRLTPQVAAELFRALRKALPPRVREKTVFLLGGTPAVCRVARNCPVFDYVVASPSDLAAVEEFLSGKKPKSAGISWPDTLVSRIGASYPYPLIRHHFGRPSLKETIAGARQIAESGALDILSLGPDQNAQQYFFRPEKMDNSLDGAGGVALRKAADLKRIYAATRRGNHPLVRCYSGTNDLDKWAVMLADAIHICFGAVPLTYYSMLDRRSERPVREAVAENLRAIRRYASLGIPVEVNESHQWALRGASPAVELAAAYISARAAKRSGVRHFVQQYMGNVPRTIAPRDDLAKMLAKAALVESLRGRTFTIYRMVRAGLASLPQDFAAAKGHLAASLTLSMHLRPHIVHVVGFSEADHAIRADELIESCFIARGAIELCLRGLPEAAADTAVIEKSKRFSEQARVVLAKVERLGDSSEPGVIAEAVRKKILYAPQTYAD